MDEITLKENKNIAIHKKTFMLSQHAGKWLLGFFVIMLLLTIISRVADSMTIPKVITTNYKREALNFVTEGIGTVCANTEMYLEIEGQLRVCQIFVQGGDPIKKGDPLFSYYKADIQNKYDKQMEAVNKAQLELEKLQLGYLLQEAISGTEVSELTKKRAELDLKQAEQELEQAQKNYDKAVIVAGEKAEKQANAETDIKQKAYDIARKNYDTVGKANKEAVMAAEREVSDAKAQLTSSHNKDASLYEQYWFEISEAETKLSRKKTDLAIVKAKWDRIINRELNDLQAMDTSDPAYATAQKNYELQIISKESEITEYERAFTDAYNDLNALKNKSLDYTEEVAVKALARAQEDLKLVKEKGENSLVEAQKALDTAGDELKEEEKDTFDYEAELSSAVQTINQATKAIETAKRTLEDANNSLLTSKKARAIEDNNMNLKNKIDILDVEIYQQNLNKLQEAAENFKKILSNDGLVISPAAGVIIKLELEKGKSTNGEEVVSIGTGKYGFKATVSKEEAKHLAAKDEIFIKTNREEQGEKTTIEYLGLVNKEGLFEITAIMPGKAYTVGTEVTFKAQKISEPYDMCLPIQALREDVKGKYVLIYSEKNTTLGTKLVATRVNIEVLDRNALTVAVSGSLKKEDNVIISCSRNIEEGDRIRVESNE